MNTTDDLKRIQSQICFQLFLYDWNYTLKLNTYLRFVLWQQHGRSWFPCRSTYC